MGVHREKAVWSQQEGGYVQSKELGLRRNHNCQPLDLGLNNLQNHLVYGVLGEERGKSFQLRSPAPVALGTVRCVCARVCVLKVVLSKTFPLNGWAWMWRDLSFWPSKSQTFLSFRLFICKKEIKKPTSESCCEGKMS